MKLSKFYCERLGFYAASAGLPVPHPAKQDEETIHIVDKYGGFLPGGKRVLPKVRQYCDEDIADQLEKLIEETRKLSPQT